MMLGMIAPITGIIGNLGYYSAYWNFPIQVVVGFMLLEPFFGQIVGIILQQDDYPGINDFISIGIKLSSFSLECRYLERELN